MSTCPECNRFLGNAGHHPQCSKRGLSPVEPHPLLGVAYHLEQHRKKEFLTTWKIGTLEEVQAELVACRKEIKDFGESEWKIIRVERWDVTSTH